MHIRSRRLPPSSLAFPLAVTSRSLLVAIALVILSLFARDARACGMFVTRPLTEAERIAQVPYLAVERVLLAWDATTQTEDFVREARFEKANQAFGFVVPVPSRPEVFEVKKAPFEALTLAFPYEQPRGRSVGEEGNMGGTGSAAPPPGPIVLSQQRIGRFTAFVLSATDGGGLKGWLEKNGFDVSVVARAWLDHFVRLHFYYVAFRYDAATGDTAGMTSETVRIRFKTPMPYYPYLEPSSGEELRGPRHLLLWFVSQEGRIPVASVRGPDGALRWKKPWEEGQAKHVPARTLRDALPSLAEIVGGDDVSTWVVSVHRDAKQSRDGWGDVLLVPTTAVAIDDAAIAARWPLLPVMDPRLEGDMDEKPLLADSFPPAPASSVRATDPSSIAAPAPSKNASPHGCAVAPGADDESLGGLAVVAAAWAIALKRRRAILVVTAVVALGSCKRAPTSTHHSTPTPTAEPAGSAAAPSSGDRTAREVAVLELMFGRTRAQRLSVDALARPMPVGNVQVGPVSQSGPAQPHAEGIAQSLRLAFWTCYKQGSQPVPRTARTIVISVKVSLDGDVTSAAAAENSGLTASVVECILQNVRYTKFDPTGFPDPSQPDEATLRIPVTFDEPRDASPG